MTDRAIVLLFFFASVGMAQDGYSLPLAKSSGDFCFSSGSEICQHPWRQFERIGGAGDKYAWMCKRESYDRWCSTDGGGAACYCSARVPDGAWVEVSRKSSRQAISQSGPMTQNPLRDEIEKYVIEPCVAQIGMRRRMKTEDVRDALRDELNVIRDGTLLDAEDQELDIRKMLYGSQRAVCSMMSLTHRSQLRQGGHRREPQ